MVEVLAEYISDSKLAAVQWGTFGGVPRGELRLRVIGHYLDSGTPSAAHRRLPEASCRSAGGSARAGRPSAPS